MIWKGEGSRNSPEAFPRHSGHWAGCPIRFGKLPCFVVSLTVSNAPSVPVLRPAVSTNDMRLAREERQGRANRVHPAT